MIPVAQLDKHLRFVREEAQRLRDMKPMPQWAYGKALRFDELGDALVEIRRDVQMTGMDGKRIEESP